MADLPRIWARPQIPQLDLPRMQAPNTFGQIAQGLGAVGEQLIRMQRGADQAEATRSFAEASQEFKGALDELSASVTNPDEFEQQATARIQEISQRRLEAASNPNVKREIESSMSPAMIAMQNSIRHIKRLKVADKAMRDYVAAKDQLIDSMANASGDNRQGVGALFAQLVGRMQADGYISAEKASKELIDFTEKVDTETVKANVGKSMALNEQLDDFANKAFLDPDNADVYMQQGLENIKDADWINDDVAAKGTREFKDKLRTGAIKGLISRDPFRAKELLKSGRFNSDLNQDSLISLTNMADAEIERRQRKVEAEQKDYLRNLGKLVDDWKAARMAGYDWAGNEAELAAAVKGTEHEPEFIRIRGMSRVLSKFNTMDELQQDVFIRQAEREPQTGDSAKFIDTLRRVQQETRRALTNDPLTHAVNQRIVDPLPPLDLNDPATLQARSLAAGVAEQHYRRPVSPLTADEAARIQGTLDTAVPDQKIAIMRQMNESFSPRHIQAIASQFEKNGRGALAQAFGMSSLNPEAAKRMVQGAEIRRTNPDTVPTGVNKTMANAYVNERLAEAYQASPEALESVRAAVNNAYAWASWEMGDLSGRFNQERMDNAIFTVTGGLVEFNGQRTLPPRYGVTSEQMRSMVEFADYSNISGVTKADVLNHGKLVAKGVGQYYVQMGHDFAVNKNGQPFVLDLSRGQLEY